MEVVHKIGRRKTAVARVYVSEGKGNITVNKRKLEDYLNKKNLDFKSYVSAVNDEGIKII